MALTTEVRRLLERPNYAHLATLLPDGAPHSVPVWIDVEGTDKVVILTGPGSRKARNVGRDPRVAISIIDVGQPYASVLIRGQVVELIDGDRAWDIIDRICQEVHRAALSTAYRSDRPTDPTRSCTGRDVRLSSATTDDKGDRHVATARSGHRPDHRRVRPLA